jgi:hypothetical protein
MQNMQCVLRPRNCPFERDMGTGGGGCGRAGGGEGQGGEAENVGKRRGHGDGGRVGEGEGRARSIANPQPSAMNHVDTKDDKAITSSQRPTGRCRRSAPAGWATCVPVTSTDPLTLAYCTPRALSAPVRLSLPDLSNRLLSGLTPCYREYENRKGLSQSRPRRFSRGY